MPSDLTKVHLGADSAVEEQKDELLHCAKAPEQHFTSVFPSDVKSHRL